MKNAFTLIEVIAVILLAGVLALASSIALLPLVEGFFQVRRNSDLAQKTNLALERVVREMTTITNVVSASQTSITYDFLDPDGAPHRRTLAWEGPGTVLALNTVPLLDGVEQFRLRYYASAAGAPGDTWTSAMRLVEITLDVESGAAPYTTRVQPRNLPDR